jgi:putative membrane protein
MNRVNFVTVAGSALALACCCASAMAADSAAGISHKDRQFIVKAGQAGAAEIAAGQLAVSKSSNPDVKQFGQHMVQDHTKAGDELKQIAQSKSLAVPSDPDWSHRHLAAKLEKANASDFDKLYIKEAGVKDHKDAVKLFTDESKNGTDPELRAFAERTLPTIQDHYRMAQDLAHSTAK